MQVPILSAILLVPLLGAILILVIPREDAQTSRRVGVAFSVLSLILATWLWVQVGRLGTGEMRFVEQYPWIAHFDIWYRVGADGLSVPLIWLTTFLTTLVLIYSAYVIQERVKEYYLLFLLLEIGLLGVFMALDLVLFYVFWEIGLVPMFLIIGVWGGKRREYAAIKFFLYTLAGSVFALLAIIAVYFDTGTFSIPDLVRLQPFSDNWLWANLAFWGLWLAFAIKIPVFPLHTWLPDAHTEAPTGGSVILAGVLLKLGAYGMLRIGLPLFPELFRYYTLDFPVLPVLALFSIVYGALVCLAQWDFKRLIAYSSVAHMGYFTLGLFAAAASSAATRDAAASALNGAVWQLFSHGIITGGMFFLVGMLYERTHTRDLRAFGGLAGRMPVYYGLTLVLALGSLGLPGLAGFWSEFFVFHGAMQLLPLAAYIGVLGMVFTAAYILWKVIQHIFLGSFDKSRWDLLSDMTWWEQVAVVPLVALTVLLGLWPAPLLWTVDAATTALLGGLP